MRRWMIIVALGTSLGSPGEAAEGRKPIFEETELIAMEADCDTNPACPDINGSYFLTNDIKQVSQGASAIKIHGNGTQRIEIDLNGFTIEAGTDGVSGIAVDSIRSLIIRNGTIVSRATTDQNSQVIRVGFLGQTGAPARSVLIENVTVVGGPRVGIGLYGVDSFTLRDNSILGPGTIGIQVKGNNQTRNSQGRIERNLIRGRNPETGVSMNSHGIEAQGDISSVIFSENQIEGTGGNGIHAAPGDPTPEVGTRALAIIIGNAIENSGFRGIFVNHTDSCRVSDNVIRKSGTADGAKGHGINLTGVSSGCLVEGNSSSGNAGHGIWVESEGHHIDRNLLFANKGAGLYINGDFNTFGRNTARENETPPAGGCTNPQAANCPASLAAPDFCDKGSGNFSFGDNLAPGAGGPC